VWSSSALFGVIIAVLTLITANRIFKAEPEEVKLARTELHHERDKAAAECAALQERWNRAGPDQFDAQHNRLKQRVIEYRGLSELRSARLNSLQITAREHRVRLYLQSHPIASSGITAIGPGRAATLRSYGYVTAADVSSDIGRIPGFGTVITNSLLGWRRYLEKQFNGMPNVGLTQAAIAEVDKEIGVRRLEIISDLRQGEATLRQLRGQVLSERQVVQPLLNSAFRAVRQAEVDLAKL
jgi:DNA-binding helix-hairpin-helix protein with protein kinase domain